MYYFLLPSSKIRDATFLFNEEGKNIIVIMSSAGYMYTQVMDESSSAQHGPFYVTNVLEIIHEDLKVIEHFLCIYKYKHYDLVVVRGKLNRVAVSHRIAMVRWQEEVCLYTTLTCCRCSSSVTVRASPLLPQSTAATWTHKDYSP